VEPAIENKKGPEMERRGNQLARSVVRKVTESKIQMQSNKIKKIEVNIKIKSGHVMTNVCKKKGSITNCPGSDLVFLALVLNQLQDKLAPLVLWVLHANLNCVTDRA
jgi:hypothetical protein